MGEQIGLILEIKSLMKKIKCSLFWITPLIAFHLLFIGTEINYELRIIKKSPLLLGVFMLISGLVVYGLYFYKIRSIEKKFIKPDSKMIDKKKDKYLFNYYSVIHMFFLIVSLYYVFEQIFQISKGYLRDNLSNLVFFIAILSSLINLILYFLNIKNYLIIINSKENVVNSRLDMVLNKIKDVLIYIWISIKAFIIFSFCLGSLLIFKIILYR